MTSAWTKSCVASFVKERLDPEDIVEGKSAGLRNSNDSRLLRIMPRFLAINGDTVTSSTMTERSIRGQSFPGMRRSSVLLRLS